MAMGIVKWFDSEKGYGYLWAEDGSEDTYIDASALERSGLSNLRKGQLVHFDLQHDRLIRQRKAVNIVPFN